jgi:hypothetical protein
MHGDDRSSSFAVSVLFADNEDKSPRSGRRIMVFSQRRRGPVAEKAKSAAQRSDADKDSDATQPSTEATSSQNEVTGAEPAGRAAGPRTATVNLPFVTAQFRAPDLHLPSRGEAGAAARGVAAFLPSPKTALYFGGLAVTAALEIIEWPVAVAIGVGTALASRGGTRLEPQGRTRPVAQTPVERASTTA